MAQMEGERSFSKPLLSLVTVIDAEEDLGDRSRTVKQVNNYVLCGRLGTGSFSKVYYAYDATTKAVYAVKRIKLKELCRTTSGIAQLEREVRLMQTFDHPNILKLKEVLHVESMHYAYLVLEYAKKGSLGSFIDRGIRLSQQSVFSVIKQIAGALRYLHDNGFVHQDIKPGNILVDENGRAILADFGIGHSFQSATMVVGSPAFQAPECLDDSASDEEENGDINGRGDEEDKSEVDPQKEDVWSLGVTLYQLLFMRLPFEGDNLFEIVQYIKSNDLSFPPDTEIPVMELIRGMLSVDQSNRLDVVDILNNPLIAQASDLAPDIPDPPKIKMKEGEIQHIDAYVCPKGYSFASVAMSIQRRLSFINAPYSPERLQPRRPSTPIIQMKQLPPFQEVNRQDSVLNDDKKIFPSKDGSKVILSLPHVKQFSPFKEIDNDTSSNNNIAQNASKISDDMNLNIPPSNQNALNKNNIQNGAQNSSPSKENHILTDSLIDDNEREPSKCNCNLW